MWREAENCGRLKLIITDAGLVLLLSRTISDTTVPGHGVGHMQGVSFGHSADIKKPLY